MATDTEDNAANEAVVEESNRNPDSNASSTGNHPEAPKPVPGGVISAENKNEREDERKWAEEIEEENRPKRSKSDLEGSKPVFLRKTRRTRSSEEIAKKNGFPRWSEYYPTEYKGKEYKSNYEYDMHFYDLGDEYQTQYYGFGHSVFKNRKSVKREYKDPPKEEKKKEEKKDDKKEDKEEKKEDEKPESPKNSPPPVVPLAAVAVAKEKTPTPAPKTPTPQPKTPTPVPKTPTPQPKTRTPSPEIVPVVAAAAVVHTARSPTPQKTRTPTPKQKTPTPPPKSPTPSPAVAPVLLAAGAGAAGGAVVAAAATRDPTPKKREPTPKEPTPKPQTPVKTEDIHIQSPSPEVAAVAAVAAVGAAAATKSAPKKKLDPVPEEKPVKEKKPKTPPPAVPVVVAQRDNKKNSKNADMSRESIARSMNKYRFK